MAGSDKLHKAKDAKNDEFYTQISDIEKELRYYKKYFKGKTILCNCDDPFESNFFKYFVLNFASFGLKKLVATCYAGSPIVYTQMALFEDMEITTTAKSDKKPYKIEITDIPDLNGDGAIDLTDVKELIKRKNNVLSLLKGNGDFRSPECLELLKEADIVITNPPFSLFRDYLQVLVQYDKKFIIIGNQTAYTTKEIFPLIMNNKVWWGASGCVRWFIAPKDTKKAYKLDDKGNKLVEGARSRWYTNLDVESRHEGIIPYKKYNPQEYPKYDNYDVIEVSETELIPCDYKGIMGVPVTFLDKYNPEQLEILGCTQRGCHDLVPDKKKYNDYWEVKQDGTRTGSSGNKTNENANLEKNDGKHNYFINEQGHIVQSCYGRVFVRYTADWIAKHPKDFKD